MSRNRSVSVAIAFLLLAAGASAASVKGPKFEWTTQSAEAKKLLAEVQARIESFETGPQLTELARKVVAADPSFAMGEYYLSAVAPPSVRSVPTSSSGTISAM